jgi:hypothetical protein
VFEVLITPATKDKPQQVNKDNPRCSLCKEKFSCEGGQTQSMLRHIRRKHPDTEVGRQLLQAEKQRQANMSVVKRAIESTVDEPAAVDAAVKVAKTPTMQRQITAFIAEPAATAAPDALPYGDKSPQQQRHDLLIMVDLACGFKSFQVRCSLCFVCVLSVFRLCFVCVASVFRAPGSGQHCFLFNVWEYGAVDADCRLALCLCRASMRCPRELSPNMLIRG